jgi:hypothetical protein
MTFSFTRVNPLGWLRVGLILACAAGVGMAAPLKATYPRLATHDIGDKNYDHADYQAVLAKYDYALLGMYPGWHGGPVAMREAVQAIKRLNPAIVVGNYTILESQYWDSDRSSNKAVFEALRKLYDSTGPTQRGGTWTPNDWWARTSDGKLVISPGYPTAATVNVTEFVTPDANGDRYPQWFAKWNHAVVFSKVPEFEVWYSDNAFYRPRVNADWDRDGQVDLKTDPAVAANLRRGIAAYWAEINRLKPGTLVMGNVDGRYDLKGKLEGFLTEPEYDHKLGGALFESALGRNFSAERQSGWDHLMAGYRSLIDHTTEPHLVVFDTKLTPEGLLFEPAAERANYGGGAPFACLRYCLASVLMEDGYFAVKNGGYNQKAAVWFDEFDRAGTADTGWLGTAVDAPQRAPYQNGVYLRRFQHGAALVNPRGAPHTRDNNRSPVDVALPTALGKFKRLAGKQDPKTNNGEPLPLNADGVPHLVLKPGDGILLVRE